MPTPRRDRAIRVGADLRVSELRPGYRLVAPRKGIHYLIAKVTKTTVWAYLRVGNRGPFGKKLVQIIPAEVYGYRIDPK